MWDMWDKWIIIQLCLLFMSALFVFIGSYYYEEQDRKEFEEKYKDEVREKLKELANILEEEERIELMKYLEEIEKDVE